MQISEARRKIAVRFGSNQLSGSWTKLTFSGGDFLKLFFFFKCLHSACFVETEFLNLAVSCDVSARPAVVRSLSDTYAFAKEKVLRQIRVSFCT